MKSHGPGCLMGPSPLPGERPGHEPGSRPGPLGFAGKSAGAAVKLARRFILTRCRVPVPPPDRVRGRTGKRTTSALTDPAAKPPQARPRVGPLWAARLSGAKADRKNVRRPVSRVLYGGEPPRRPFIWDGACAPPRATYPDADAKARLADEPPCIPIRPCSGRGLPCPLPCGRGGGLLPHRFILAGARKRAVPAVCFLRRCP